MGNKNSGNKNKGLYYTNGINEKRIPIGEEIPVGFVRGRLPMKAEQKEKCSKSHVGKHHTEEAKRKISLHSNNNRRKAFETIKREYGSTENYFKQIQGKVDKTKRIRHSFNQSNIENDYYRKLCEKYDKRNVLRNYKTSKYPYRCDFYIKPLNLYIEINNHWTHGEHPFDENNPEDINILNKWKEKAEISQFYKNAIETWTVRDVEKLNCLRNNNLNFKIIYPNEIIEK